MRLFNIDDNFQIELNKEWILLIPEFEALLKRDKGSKGDYRGDKKLKARKELTFIYFDLDFTSPIREWEDFERREEAMKYAGLTEADLDGPVMAAHKKYNDLLLQSSRSMKTLRAVEKGLDALDKYFEEVDFAKADTKGTLLYNPKQYIDNIKGLNAAYDALDNFRKRVAEELKGDASIRGTASLGRKEGRRTEWEEGMNEPDDTQQENIEPIKQTSMADVAKLLASTQGYSSEDTE